MFDCITQRRLSGAGLVLGGLALLLSATGALAVPPTTDPVQTIATCVEGGASNTELACGDSATTAGSAVGGTAIGSFSRATGLLSTSLGYAAWALNPLTTVVGASRAANEGATVLGANIGLVAGTSPGRYSTTIGAGDDGANAPFAGGGYSVAIGGGENDPVFCPNCPGANASARFGIAIGLMSKSLDDGAVAMGLRASASGIYSVAIGNNASGLGLWATAIGTDTRAVDQSFAGGAGASALGSKSIALGTQSSATGARSIAIGNLASTAIFLGGTDAVAIGNSALAGGNNSIALGLRASTYGADIAAGAQDAVAIGNTATATRNGAVAVGLNSTASGVNAIAIGTGATATGSVAVGAGASAALGGAAFGDGAIATATNSTAIGPGAQALAANAVAIGSGSIASQANTVSVGAPGAERRITNVAPGVASTDVATFGQLQAATAATASQIALLRDDLHDGVASTVALSGMLMPSAPGATTVTSNFGFYGGSTAMGVNVAHRFDTQVPFVVEGGVATAMGGRQTVGRVGMAIEF